ncbi:hypothetical protein JW916_14895 [Candidatus Sumerlaeota bacterium]|nr:hypothetical protein [Candidatus Sumerlaeota bacterium]
MSADSFMGVVEIGLALQASKTQTSLMAATARKSLDIQRTEGQLALQLLESARQATLSPEGLIDTVA